jgi:hypothetical protein
MKELTENLAIFFIMAFAMGLVLTLVLGPSILLIWGIIKLV